MRYYSIVSAWGSQLVFVFVFVAAAPLSLAACEDPPPEVIDPCAAARVRPGAADLAFPTQCGSELEFTPINRYEGEIVGIQEREEAVVLINGSCTGTLIEASAGPVVITAGHCVGLGDDAVIAFNVEDEPDGDPLVTAGTVIERADEPDYALIELAALPAIAPTLLTTLPTDLLAIIQHPRGRPKVVAEGRLIGSCDGLVYYADLDTLVGSSGAAVLTREGHVFGIHTDGTCTEDGSGTNFGWTAARIVEASPYLVDADLAAR
jgi:hypothetical protein